MNVGDRVRTPMPVKPPKGRRGEPSQTGTVEALTNAGTVAYVQMDGVGIKVSFRIDTLEAL